MKIINPLLNEQKRFRRNGFLLALLLAAAMGLLDYLTAVSDRIDLRQTQLNAATSDLDHQLLPLLHLTKVLQQEASAALLKDSGGTVLLDGKVSVLGGADAQTQPLSSAEISMLNQLTPVFRQQLKASRYLLNLSYLSETRHWYHLEDVDARGLEMADSALQQIRAMPHLQATSETTNLLVLDEIKHKYGLQLPVRQGKNVVGHLLLEIDLLDIMRQIKLAEAKTLLLLMDKVGKGVLAVQDGQLADSSLYNGSHQHDNLQHLALLPFALHLQPDADADRSRELRTFLLGLASYLVPMMLLYFYLLSRFKRKVLRPFSRLLIHVARLARGDNQGVRHIPMEWESVFRQTEDIRGSGSEKSDQ